MSNIRCEWIWWNGTWKRWEEATVNLATHALHYGSSVFEGLRAYDTPEGPAILGLSPHVRRFIDSCKNVRGELPYSFEELSQAITSLVERNGHRSCYIRPLAFRRAGGLDACKNPLDVVVSSWEWGQYSAAEALEHGVDVCVNSWRRPVADTTPLMAKIGGNYVGPQLASMEAVDKGPDQAICLDRFGNVSEGGSESLFLVRGGALVTPVQASTTLASVNRNYVVALARSLGMEVREERIARDMLYCADELFFTGTAAEITPICSVDRMVVGQGQPGPTTRALQEQFFAIVSGRASDRMGWLTPIRRSYSPWAGLNGRGHANVA